MGRTTTRTAGAAAVATAALAVLLGGCAAAGPGAASTQGSTGPAAVRTLGPAGLGEFRIGMSLKDAEATGQFQHGREQPGACMSTTNGQGITMTWSGRYGITMLTADGVSTPEGIRVGSTYAEVKQAYPRPSGPLAGTLDEQFSELHVVYVQVPGNAAAAYAIQFDDTSRVRQILLKLKAQRDC